MTIIKCKMCGGDIELSADRTWGVCDSCGSKMTFPKADEERRVNLFNRANHFRRQNEFDKAVTAYERILEEDNTDAEAHWGVVLSRFGIEYVEDPVTRQRIPTCHRVQAESILTDADYLAAVQYAPDAAVRSLYESEAKYIAEIQRGILAISAQEQPCDVFLCYKETDANGQRTRDSVIAQEIYHELTGAGYRVFFARISLEDKLGRQYEPYIFAALNSAKVMLVIGTKQEHFSAVWVKNEWSRFLALMKQDRSRLLIPCYRDMDAYDLPEELSALQSQDMGKIGFMQDLLRGVQKVLAKQEAPRAAQQEHEAAPAAMADPLLRRAYLFLEDGDWQSADEYFERVLDMEPENARAYLGKLMAELHVKKQEQLKSCAEPFDHLSNYKKAMRFGDEALQRMLTDSVDYIRRRNEHARLEKLYKAACEARDNASDEENYLHAAQLYEEIGRYKDSAQQAQQCREKAEVCRKEVFYHNAKKNMAGTSVSNYEYAINQLKKISGWRDADELLEKCLKRIEELKIKEQADEAERQRQEEIYRRKQAAKARKRMMLILTAVIVVILIVGAAGLYNGVIVPNGKYDAAVALKNAGQYDEAITAFTELEGYKDSNAQIMVCRYDAAMKLKTAGQYDEAIAAFSEIKWYKDSKMQIAACETAILDGKYDAALALMTAGQYDEAIEAFTAIADYRDSAVQIEACKTAILDGKYAAAAALMNEGKYDEAIAAFAAIETHRDSAAQIKACKTAINEEKYKAAMALMASGKYDEAIEAFSELGVYKDSRKQIEVCETAILDGKYNDAVGLMEKGYYAEAYKAFMALNDHKDSMIRAREIYLTYLNPTLQNAVVGQYITFGVYEQDNNIPNGQEPIEWLVLNKQDNRVFVISRYSLEYMEFDQLPGKESWEKCSLRKWLNEDFYQEAFDVVQRTMIPRVKIDVETGNSWDQVFLLSINEANRYFSSNEARMCQASAYVLRRWNSNMQKELPWWLRTDGSENVTRNKNIANVLSNGMISELGSITYYEKAVRPAMWINLEP